MQTLDFSGNSLAGGGELLAEVMGAPVLEELCLAHCGLEFEDVEAVAQELPFTSLRSLQLAGNDLAAAGLKVLSEHLPKCRLDVLGLERNGLKSEDLSCLGQAWAKRPFSRLRLSGNQMSDEELKAFIDTLRSLAHHEFHAKLSTVSLDDEFGYLSTADRRRHGQRHVPERMSHQGHQALEELLKQEEELLRFKENELQARREAVALRLQRKHPPRPEDPRLKDRETRGELEEWQARERELQEALKEAPFLRSDHKEGQWLARITALQEELKQKSEKVKALRAKEQELEAELRTRLYQDSDLLPVLRWAASELVQVGAHKQFARSFAVLF
eukprot:g11440.t1